MSSQLVIIVLIFAVVHGGGELELKGENVCTQMVRLTECCSKGGESTGVFSGS